jgi:hypothetical protein
MSRDHHPPLRDITADTEDTASSIFACWTVFTELLPGSTLIKSVTKLWSFSQSPDDTLIITNYIYWHWDVTLPMNEFTLHSNSYFILFTKKNAGKFFG